MSIRFNELLFVGLLLRSLVKNKVFNKVAVRIDLFPFGDFF